jgi:hypothetical protein
LEILISQPSTDPKEGTMNHTDFVAIEGHIRRANLQRSAYLGELLGNALAAMWKHAAVVISDLKAALQGAKAGMEEHRRRRNG